MAPIHPSKDVLYRNDKGAWVPGRRPARGETVTTRTGIPFSSTAFYYANIIDYGRVALSLVALYFILQAPAWRYTIGTVIMLNVLLDWVDGPVARHYGQSSIIGCGWDWLADILAQYNLAIWSMAALPPGDPLASFVVVFTCVEIATGLFDFAVSATAVYPAETESDKLHWLFKVEHWLTPNQTYNHLGVACWLINTAFPISVCVQAPVYLSLPMLPFALLYAWHEVCQLVFILVNWQERTAALSSGVEYMRACSAPEVALLTDVLNSTKEQRPPPASSVINRSIYWHNIYNNGKFELEFPRRGDIDDYVHSLLREFYPDEKPRHLLSYGFIVSPSHGKESQGWHMDYSPSVSNLFIPMTAVTHRNTTQFLRGELEMEMPPSQYYPEPHQLLEIEKGPALEVSQVVCKPFSILKLFPGVVHRGIANEEAFDRILFFISTNTEWLDIGESFSYDAQGETVSTSVYKSLVEDKSLVQDRLGAGEGVAQPKGGDPGDGTGPARRNQTDGHRGFSDGGSGSGLRARHGAASGGAH